MAGFYPGAQGGTNMLQHTGMCHPNGLLFHQKSLDKIKNLRRESHFTNKKKLQKKKKKNLVKSALEMDPDLQKFRKKKKNSLFLEGEKSFDMSNSDLDLQTCKKKKKK